MMGSAAHFEPDLTPQSLCRMHKITPGSVRVLGLEAAPCTVLQSLDGGTCQNGRVPLAEHGMKDTEEPDLSPKCSSWGMQPPLHCSLLLESPSGAKPS